MAIIRAPFTAQYLTGVGQANDPWVVIHNVARQDETALLYPDTSKIPLWRQRPERVEHSIRAWRCWGLIAEDNMYASRKESHDWYLSSVAANCTWEGPVLRAHKRPVDPVYWDAKKKVASEREYYDEMHDTFSLAGIHALKTKEQAIETTDDYDVPVYGEVDLWGRVAQFELGYRAEACMIRHLYIIKSAFFRRYNAQNDQREWLRIKDDLALITEQLPRRYGCEVTLV